MRISFQIIYKWFLFVTINVYDFSIGCPVNMCNILQSNAHLMWQDLFDLNINH